MGVADREVNLKKEKEACSSKQREEEKVYEEAARARSEPEALDSRYPLVDSGSDYEFFFFPSFSFGFAFAFLCRSCLCPIRRLMRCVWQDHSEGGNSEDCGSWEEVVESGEGGATRFDSDQGDGDATIFDSDEVLFFWDESEDENSQEFELSDSGEGYSQEQKAASSQSFTRRPNGIASMSMALPPRGRQQLVLPSCGLQQLLSSTPSLPTFCPRTSTSVSMERFTSPRVVCRSGSLQSAVAVAVSNGRLDSERREIRLGLPSKGRIADGALDLLKGCQLSVKQLNPRQYVTEIPQLSNLQVWLQRPKDIVRALLSGHLDIGIVGLDTVSEYGQGNKDLIIVHEALGFGDCHLSLAIPNYVIFEKIKSVKELSQMPQWTEEKPLRVATGFIYLGPKFMKENGLKHVRFLTGEGALEAFPAMGTADVILDLVSSGKTLRENNLKEIEGGKVLESQAVLVASRKSLVQREGVRDTTREILERLEAHLKAVDQLMVTANMRGSSAEEVAKLVLGQPSLSGLHGPTISQVFCIRDGEVVADCYAIAICVPKKALDSSVRQLRAIGGSEVLVYPLTYILDEGSPRWQQLLSELGL